MPYSVGNFVEVNTRLDVCKLTLTLTIILTITLTISPHHDKIVGDLVEIDTGLDVCKLSDADTVGGM